MYACYPYLSIKSSYFLWIYHNEKISPIKSFFKRDYENGINDKHMMNFMERCTNTLQVYRNDSNIAAKIIYEIIFLISDWKLQPGNEYCTKESNNNT